MVQIGKQDLKKKKKVISELLEATNKKYLS